MHLSFNHSEYQSKTCIHCKIKMKKLLQMTINFHLRQMLHLGET